MMDARVNINGTVFTAENAKISVFDRGFLFGDGVYETGKSRSRCFLFLEEHLSRLRRSAGSLRIAVPWSDDQLKQELFETARAFGRSEAYFRMIVTRGSIERVGLDVSEEGGATRVILVQELSARLTEIQRSGVRLVTSTIVRNSPLAQDPNIKTSNYLNSLLAFQDAKTRGGDDAVMCDARGFVTEGTTFSIFGFTDEGQLITPSLKVGILDSITRRHVLELAQSLGPVHEGFFPLSELQGCREVFIASSVREVVPVCQWDNSSYEAPGRLTKKIQALLSEEIDRYVKNHEKY